MKKARWTHYLALCAAVVLSGCGSSFLSSASLAGETMTYATAYIMAGTGYVPNGHDTISFTFDSTGRGGTFVETDYFFGYATPEAVTADVYANSVWFQDGGYKGEFTYDSNTCSLSLTVTDVYTTKAGATMMSCGYYAEASYEYQDIATALGNDEAEFAMTVFALFTPDTLAPVLPSGSSASIWGGACSFSMAQDVMGSLYEQTSDTSVSYSITESAVSVVSTTVTNATWGGATLTTTTIEESDYSVLKYFLIGQSDIAGLTWANAWRYGNEVSFQLNRTLYTKIEYEGETAPTAPTVDPATGHIESSGGTAGTDAWTYDIDTRLSTEVMEYAHKGTYIVDLDQGVSAVRSILPR